MYATFRFFRPTRQHVICGVHSQAQILLSACQISKFQNFHNFLNSHQPEGCFLSDRQKSLELYALKNVKKKKAYSCFIFFKRATAPPSTADPKKAKKIDFDFCQFFLHFWLRLLDTVLMNTMFMTRNEGGSRL
jgi:hypothetical protein